MHKILSDIFTLNNLHTVQELIHLMIWYSLNSARH